MAFNYSRAQKVCDRQIRRFGAQHAVTAKLRRAGADRGCVAARLEYTPKEQGLFEDGASRILISVIDLQGEKPDHDLDQVVFAGEVYNIIAPIKMIRQGGSEILFFDCPVMLIGNS